MTKSELQGRKAYRIRQAAELLSLPYSTLYDIVRRGELASVRIGTGARKITLIPQAALDELLSKKLRRNRQRKQG